MYSSPEIKPKCATYLAKYIYLWSSRFCIQLWKKYDSSFIMYSTSTMGIPCPRKQDSRNTALLILTIHPFPQFTSCRHCLGDMATEQGDSSCRTRDLHSVLGLNFGCFPQSLQVDSFPVLLRSLFINRSSYHSWTCAYYQLLMASWYNP
jgi:hypothetical protein